MAVYTHFGSMSGLVREVMREGFERFKARTDVVVPSDDPVADLYAICRVYQEFARAEPHVRRCTAAGRAGYFTGARTADETLPALVRDFAIAQGDGVEAASASAPVPLRSLP